MNDDSTPDGIRVRSRAIGRVYPDDDTVITVEHVYEPDGTSVCDDCGRPAHDPGMVGLVISSLDDEDGEPDAVPVLMSAEDALTLANRLTRAASLVLESEEGLPDIERDMARYAPAEGKVPGSE